MFFFANGVGTPAHFTYKLNFSFHCHVDDTIANIFSSPMIAPELLRRFPAGTPADTASQYLQAAGGNIAAAVEMFEAGHQLPQAGRNNTAATTVSGTSSTSGRNNRQEQNYFVGGGQSSGQAVVAPPSQPSSNARGRNSNSEDITDSIENVFAKARENGARDGVTDGGSSVSTTTAFAGTGRRLGHTEGPSPVIAAHTRHRRSIRITFYENGFQIEDGPLRSLTDEAGLRFLESINRGFIPRELISEFGDVDIDVNLVDRREEPYRPPPPPAYNAFGGAGRTTASATTPTTPNVQQAASAAAAAPVVVNRDEETCKIAIINLTGKRCEIEVNPARHTIADIRTLASELQGTPPLPRNSFQLLIRDIPPRALTDDSLTVNQASLRHATLMMKRC